MFDRIDAPRSQFVYPPRLSNSPVALIDDLPQTTDDDSETNPLVKWGLIGGGVIVGIIVLNYLLGVIFWAVGWLLYLGLAALAAYLAYRAVGWVLGDDTDASTRDVDDEQLEDDMVENASVDDLAQLEHDEETELDLDGSIGEDDELERELEAIERQHDVNS